MLAKLLHISLAILVFLSTSGLVLSKHYCGGVLKNVALFGEAASCHENNAMEACPLHSSMKMSEDDTSEDSSCCDTKSELLKADTEKAEITVDFSLTDYPVLLAVLLVLSGVSPVESDSKTTHYLSYKPPLLVCDLPVRFQTFLC